MDELSSEAIRSLLTSLFPYPSSDKRVNRRLTATCGGNDEERVEWMISPRRRFDRC